MSMINSLLKQQKGFTSFLFVFIFLYSGILRGVITTDVIDYVSNYAQHDSETKSTFSAQQNHFNGFSIANQNKEKSESETDEAPAREITKSAAAYTKSILSINDTTCVFLTPSYFLYSS